MSNVFVFLSKPMAGPVLDSLAGTLLPEASKSKSKTDKPKVNLWVSLYIYRYQDVRLLDPVVKSLVGAMFSVCQSRADRHSFKCRLLCMFLVILHCFS